MQISFFKKVLRFLWHFVIVFLGLFLIALLFGIPIQYLSNSTTDNFFLILLLLLFILGLLFFAGKVSSIFGRKFVEKTSIGKNGLRTILFIMLLLIVCNSVMGIYNWYALDTLYRNGLLSIDPYMNLQESLVGGFVEIISLISFWISSLSVYKNESRTLKEKITEKEKKTIRISINKSIVTVIFVFILIAILGFLFYWFEYRPSQIRQDCYWYESEDGNWKEVETPDQYRRCLLENGLKVDGY